MHLTLYVNTYMFSYNFENESFEREVSPVDYPPIVRPIFDWSEMEEHFPQAAPQMDYSLLAQVIYNCMYIYNVHYVHLCTCRCYRRKHKMFLLHLKNRYMYKYTSLWCMCTYTCTYMYLLYLSCTCMYMYNVHVLCIIYHLHVHVYVY